jgi:hypothetical protein
MKKIVAPATKLKVEKPLESAASATATPATPATRTGTASVVKAVAPDGTIPPDEDPKFGSKDANVLAGHLQKGLLTFSAEVWAAGGAALIDVMKNGSGAAAHHTRDHGQSQMQFKKAAAAEVVRLWKIGPENEDLLQALFPKKRDIPKRRRAGFEALLSFAHKATRSADRLLWNSESADPLVASIRHAWEPLGIWDEAKLKSAVSEAKELFENPIGRMQISRLALNPLIARWLAVMRAKQLFLSKTRPKKQSQKRPAS